MKSAICIEKFNYPTDLSFRLAPTTPYSDATVIHFKEGQLYQYHEKFDFTRLHTIGSENSEKIMTGITYEIVDITKTVIVTLSGYEFKKHFRPFV